MPRDERRIWLHLILACLSMALSACRHTYPIIDVSTSTHLLGLKHTQLNLPTTHIKEQERLFPGSVGWIEALHIALYLFCFDTRDPESAAALLAEYGRFWLADPATRLALVHPEHEAPGGEQINNAWLFTLSIPALSDHLFWAVVHRRHDRDGHIHAYSYGFN